MKTLALIALGLVLIVVDVFVYLRYFTCCFTNPTKALDMALMKDEAANVGANGQVEMTYSLRCDIYKRNGKWLGRFMCWWLGKIQPNHCGLALTHALARASARVAYLTKLSQES